MRRISSAILIIFVLLAASCRPQAEISTEEAVIETWADLFTSFWDKMNTQYVFWDLDSPGGEWDYVYFEYLPKFRSLKGLIGESEEETDTALRYFYDILSDLSDCHYSLRINDGGKAPVLTFSKYHQNLLSLSGHSDEDIFSIFRSGSLPEISDLRKTIGTVLSDSFGVSIDTAAPFFSGEVSPSSYLSLCHVFALPEANAYYVLGKTEDEILYIGLSDFNMALFRSGISGEEVRKGIEDFISIWRGFIQDYLAGEGAEIKGLVVDLRGNTGGYNSDIPLLWNCLIAEDVHICDYRSKDGMNRTDYGPWVKYIVQHDENTKRNFDMPIAVLANKATISNGEIFAMFFKALGDYYGFCTASFGEATAGGLGTANSSPDGNIYEFFDPYVFNAGQFNIGSAVCQTQSMHARYRNGEIYENIGISPDYPVAEDGAGDAVLSNALSWIRKDSQP